MPLINSKLDVLHKLKATKDDLVFLEDRCIAEYMRKDAFERFEKKYEK